MSAARTAPSSDSSPVAVQRVAAGRAAGVGQPVLSPAEALRRDLELARQFAKLLDSQFEVGGFKFGLDSIVGLVPVAGDLASFAMGLYPVYLARRHGLGKLLVARMMGNLGADFVVGSVPLIGDAADVFFKAHLRNLRLLEAAAQRKLASLAQR